ncbi:hypothetical protein LAV82_22870 [Bacillus sp. ILBB4]|nr:hypothetical protein [Bacillus sp. ILBB4]
MPLESFPPGFKLKGQEDPPVEEQTEVIEEPATSDEQKEENETPQEPDAPVVDLIVQPTDLSSVTPTNTTRTTLYWGYTGDISAVKFLIYLDDAVYSTIESNSKYLIVEALGENTYGFITDDLKEGSYKFYVKAVSDSNIVGETSEEFYFEVVKPQGIDNQNYWLPSKIDNISVTYKK